MKAIISFLRQHPRLIISLMILLMAVGGYGASKSQVDNSLKVWQSEDDPHWLAYQEFLAQSQLSDPLVIFIPHALDSFVLEELSDSLSNLPFVSYCQDVQLTTTTQSTATLLTLTPIKEATPRQLAGILQDVQTTLTTQNISTYHLGGVWYLTNQLDDLSAKATTVLFPVILLVVSITIFWICRQQAILILACGFIPALLLVGIMGLCGVRMNMVLLALPPLTLILGMAHGVHFTIKIWEPADNATRVFLRVAPPCTLSGMTTAMGFGSLLLSSYQPVQQLGLWGAVGTALSLTITFILIPTFLQRNKQTLKFQLPGQLSQQLEQHRGKILMMLMLIIALALIGLGRLQTGSLILDFFADDSPIRQNYTSIEEAGIGLTPMEVNLYDRNFSGARLNAPLQKLADTHPEISHFISTMADGSQQVMSLGAIFKVPEMDTPHQTVARITILMQTISSEATLTIATAIESFLQNQLGKSSTPYITGSVPLYTRGQHELFRSMLESFSLAFLSISILIGFLLRSVKMTFVAMVPNLLPVVLIIASMGLLAIPLSVATMTVASIIFGIVIDDTIHCLYTYQKLENLPIHQRINGVFNQVGTPIITTTLVTGTGFLAFLASPFIPLGHFGLLISIALWMALLCDLCILPLLLQATDHD